MRPILLDIFIANVPCLSLKKILLDLRIQGINLLLDLKGAFEGGEDTAVGADVLQFKVALGEQIQTGTRMVSISCIG